MMEFKIRIKDLEDFKRTLKKLPRQLEKQLGIAMKKSIFLIERESKILVSGRMVKVQTGRLRTSIKPDFIRTFEGAISPHTDYAIFLHEGTRHITARPFMVRGIEKAAPTIDALFNGAVEKALMKSIY